MKLGIVLESNNPEHVWNTFRLGITALKSSHSVSIFLLNEGSELESIPDTESFDVSQRVIAFRTRGGKILACGTCLEHRGKKGTEVCPISTMGDLLMLIEESDKVLVFS